MPSQEVRGFLQLCADRRYHRKAMAEFERVTNLAPDEYWIEATAGGPPAFGAATPTATYAYDNGATIMGWAAHGDGCGGFPGVDDEGMKAKLQAAAADRAIDFPTVEHWTLFGAGGEVEASALP